MSSIITPDLPDFYKQVPKGYQDNLDFRYKIRKQAATDPVFRRAIHHVCKQDVLYFFNTFCWLYEPRRRFLNGKELPNVIPFTTWSHQDPVILTIKKNLGVRDIGVEKSRGEGLSWIGVLFALHDWIFYDMSAIGFVSRNQDAADSPDDPDSMMWKVDWSLTKLPKWMVGVKDTDYKRDRSRHNILNLRNQSTITAYAATGDVASGGRKKYFVAQPLDAKILTPSGWSTMREMEEGSLVIGGDGKPTAVTATCDHGVQEVYEITFDDGSATRCCADHLWSVLSTRQRHSNHSPVSDRISKWRGIPHRERFERRPLKELMGDYRCKNGRWKKGKYHIPVTGVVEFPPVEIPFDPYFVGAWIGDGSCAGKETPCFASNDPEIVERLSKSLPPGSQFKKKRHQVYSATNIDGPRNASNILKEQLRQLDMLRVGKGKRIPDAYLRSSFEQRLELIRGLMDTDGNIRKQPGNEKSSCTQFTTISPVLASQFQELVWSLGGICRVKKKYPYCVKPNGTRVKGSAAYCCYPVMPNGMNPFWLKRKADKYCDRSKYPPTRLIRNIELVGKEPVRCIAVESEKHLYLTDDYIVTSNCDELAKFPKPADRDAMASTQHVTDCRLVISTPKGTEGAYYDFMHIASDMEKITVDWKDNPSRNRGLYRMKGDLPVAIDHVNNPLPKNYRPPSQEILDRFSRLRKRGYDLKSTVRSPWFDIQCDRPGATPQNIAQELERDYGGSMFRYFGSDFMQVIQKTILPPMFKGDIFLDSEEITCEFDEMAGGPVSVWCSLDSNRKPQAGRQFCAAADISAGGGGSHTSNSVLQVFDALNREQVLEYTVNTLPPADFCNRCVAICKWFNDAYLAWEINGPGGGFSTRIAELRYSNCYRRPRPLGSSKKKTKDIGWHTSRNTKESMFSDFSIGVKNGEIVVRSEELRVEAGQYIRKNGAIEHEGGSASKDDSSGGEAHGDSVIAACICFQAMRDKAPPLKTKVSKDSDEFDESRKAPPNSMAARHMEWLESQRKEADDWDDPFSRGGSQLDMLEFMN